MTAERTIEQLVDELQKHAHAGIVRFQFNGEYWDVEWREEFEDPDGGVDWHRWRYSDSDWTDLRTSLEAALHLIRTGADDYDPDDPPGQPEEFCGG